MNRGVVVACLVAGLAVVWFLTATDVMNVIAAISITIVLFLIAGAELKRRSRRRATRSPPT
ncbi:hypothetical protein SRB5_09340 [Streptomyces sp. RB5]|uniref:Uncharacterized protein n=1 Tax=Streptomyces smaragdinus TaxID=2585196 RepID=A0A7K0CBI6_9ACTN|nr:hypothetical protein [Streptomyces smaragdinus]MQY10821.1 hypothetical protein [Streptomyces smaragdinus]